MQGKSWIILHLRVREMRSYRAAGSEVTDKKIKADLSDHLLKQQASRWPQTPKSWEASKRLTCREKACFITSCRDDEQATKRLASFRPRTPLRNSTAVLRALCTSITHANERLKWSAIITRILTELARSNLKWSLWAWTDVYGLWFAPAFDRRLSKKVNVFKIKDYLVRIGSLNMATYGISHFVKP